jgi:hypothetical protein
MNDAKRAHALLDQKIDEFLCGEEPQLPPEERHLGWAITAVLSGAQVRHPAWQPDLYWELADDGKIVWSIGGEQQGRVPLHDAAGERGFELYTPEAVEPLPEPTAEAFAAVKESLAFAHDDIAGARSYLTRQMDMGFERLDARIENFAARMEEVERLCGAFDELREELETLVELKPRIRLDMG